MEDCQTLDQGKNVRSLGPEVEGVTGTMCDEWAAVPHSPSPCAVWEDVEIWGVKLRAERREGWGEGNFKLWFYFSFSDSDLVGSKVN